MESFILNRLHCFMVWHLSFNWRSILFKYFTFHWNHLIEMWIKIWSSFHSFGMFRMFNIRMSPLLSYHTETIKQYRTSQRQSLHCICFYTFLFFKVGDSSLSVQLGTFIGMCNIAKFVRFIRYIILKYMRLSTVKQYAPSWFRWISVLWISGQPLTRKKKKIKMKNVTFNILHSVTFTLWAYAEVMAIGS